MTFVDVIVGTGVMLVVFLAIFGAYQLAIELVLNTKARIGGQSLASQQLEYLRALPYESLGTVGGIPSGAVPQIATTTLNAIPYTIRTLIRYVDDSADGAGAADTNGITADYKEIKVETLWSIRGRSYSTAAVTRVAPHGIESLTSGGTLRVNIFGALAQPIQGASVRITNASTSPAVDVTVLTDATGSVAFPGAPPASNYKIVVTKDGYSSAQTYDITAGNPNPNPGHVSVANQQTTTASFAIDETGSLDVYTFSPIEVGQYVDEFTNESGIAATTSTDVVAGELVLVEGAGYPASGEATSVDITPADLASWDSLDFSYSAPPGTGVAVQVVYPSGGAYTPVADGVLPGNSSGFTLGPVDLSGVATSSYPTLALRALLTTGDASTTPSVLEWTVGYHAGPSALPGIGFSVYGTKTIGTTISGAPIYKFVDNETTSQVGSWLIVPLEWDSFTISLTGSSYDIAEQCPAPLSVDPGQAQTVRLMLLPHTAHSLRVLTTANGAPLAGATVTIAGTGGGTGSTSSCGQTFFSSLSAETYTLTVTAPGYADSVQDIDVTGTSVILVQLTPL